MLPALTTHIGGERNRLLAALPAQELRELANRLETVQLHARQVLVALDRPVRDIHFPRDAVASVVVAMEDGATIEGANIGNEGLIGLEGVLGNGTSTEDVVVQIPGEAVRIGISDFRAAVERSTVIQQLVHEYTLALINQLARTAACNQIHSVEERVARLLLMSLDRVGRDDFPLTHEYLGIMLGVRRASVSTAAETMRRAGLIEYHRGQITIRDRDRLEEVACEDYVASREVEDPLYTHCRCAATRLTGWPPGLFVAARVPRRPIGRPHVAVESVLWRRVFARSRSGRCARPASVAP
jgi:CRP-like cAMP-binding protein